MMSEGECETALSVSECECLLPVRVELVMTTSSHPLKGTKALITFQSLSYLLASLILETYNRI